MNFFFTGPSSLESAVAAAGHTILSSPDLWREAFLDELQPETADYPLQKILREHAPKTDVLVLVDVLRQYESPYENKIVTIGYHKGHVIPWVGQLRGRLAVSLARDPETYQTYAGGCTMRPCQTYFYVTDHKDIALKQSKKVRTVLYRDGDSAASFLDAVAVARRGRPYALSEPRPYVSSESSS